MLTLAQSHASYFSALRVRLVVLFLALGIGVPEEGPRESTPFALTEVVGSPALGMALPFPLLFPCPPPIPKNIRID